MVLALPSVRTVGVGPLAVRTVQPGGGRPPGSSERERTPAGSHGHELGLRRREEVRPGEGQRTAQSRKTVIHGGRDRLREPLRRRPGRPLLHRVRQHLVELRLVFRQVARGPAARRSPRRSPRTPRSGRRLRLAQHDDSGRRAARTRPGRCRSAPAAWPGRPGGWRRARAARPRRPPGAAGTALRSSAGTGGGGDDDAAQCRVGRRRSRLAGARNPQQAAADALAG